MGREDFYSGRKERQEAAGKETGILMKIMRLFEGGKK